MTRRTGRYYLKLLSMLVFQLTVAAVLLTVVLVYVSVSSMLHPRRIPASGELLRAENIPYQDVTFETKDGVTLSGWYIPPQNGAMILVAHGYNDNRPESITAMFALNGYGVLAWDFRAHGESGGDISTLGYFEQSDMEAALDYALAQDGVEHIGAWGGSMGAATVILTAARRVEIEAMVVDSSFLSLESLLRSSIHDQFLFPIVETIAEYQSGADIQAVNPMDEIGKISPRAVFVIDGWSGEIVETSPPYRLYDAADEPKDIWVEKDVPHLGMYAHNPKKYQRQVINFFDQYLLNKK